MRNLNIYLVLLLCLFVNEILGQETFEKRAKDIASRIEAITKEEKEALKSEVEALNNQLIDGTITKDDAEAKKKVLAEVRAKNIESRVAKEQEALNNLVQEKVDGNMKSDKDFHFLLFHTSDGRNHEKFKKNNDSIKKYSRTDSQLVFATGVNNLVTDGAVANSKFRYMQSRFYEWGLTLNSRIFPNHNLLHAIYGFSLMYNDLRPTDNRYFVVNGNQTDLMTNTIPQKDARFRNVNLVFPLHLEFDFTKPTVKDGKTYFKSHNSFRFGLGGYFGANLKSKQILEYDQNDYHRIEKTRGDYNENTFIYGLSTYIGYKATSLYLKYDLNPLFKDNPVKQNNVSFGLRFDFN